mgnify:CR=1 FL=1
MGGHIACLDGSANAMKSKTKLSGLVLLALYLVTVFWVFIVRHSAGAMVYSLTFLWIVLPVTTLVISFLIGRNDYWGKGKWVTSVGFGVMYMLAEYATFSMANNLAFGKVNMPEASMVPAGAAISLVGNFLYRNGAWVSGLHYEEALGKRHDVEFLCRLC